ncbi:TPA: cysteine synthase B [Candidatus Dependentiae bacterium]|nr:MAG: Cysteine synthase [candidate division TM6 bacterium GW2011_GWF2_43_87]HBL98634.1 cysteine synthase B [Candidatus Dependentiae bacterium]
MKYTGIWKSVGNTPVVELAQYSTSDVKILAKLEGSNPGGSVKDRIALFMIQDAQKRGLLTSGKKIIEATSGNTGIGLASLAAVFGYPFIAVMPESVSLERRKLLEAFGAELVLTDGPKGTNYAIEVARKMVHDDPDQYIMLDQFENQANVQAHYETTGPEIILDVPEITHFVSAMGTGGTLMGVGRRLKEFNSAIQIVGVEPKPFSTIQGLRNMTAYTPPIYDKSKLDRVLFIAEDEWAFDLAREIHKKEGISVGMSSGAALWGALELAKNLKKGVIVTVFPDRGDRYTSTKLFKG